MMMIMISIIRSAFTRRNIRKKEKKDYNIEWDSIT